MTLSEINRLKFIRKIHPNIDETKVEKYYCINCNNYACRGKGGFYTRFSGQEFVDNSLIIRFNQIDKRTGYGRIFEVYTCFEEINNDTF